jgi:hypothetical protein
MYIKNTRGLALNIDKLNKLISSFKFEKPEKLLDQFLDEENLIKRNNFYLNLFLPLVKERPLCR